MGGFGNALDQYYEGAAGVADGAFGDFDEAVGRAVDDATSGDWAGVGDAAAGGLDEAFGEATDSALDGDWAGVFDAAAGSTDEAFGRAAAEMRDGDVFGAADHALGGLDESMSQAYQGYAGMLDALGGNVDESIGRQFDDQPGGGFGDMTVDIAEEATNAAANVVESVSPEWASWLMDNSWVLPVALVVFGGLYATEGTVGTTSS